MEVICSRIFNFFVYLLKVPQSTYRAPVEEDVIAKIREENRKRAEVSFKHTNSLVSLLSFYTLHMFYSSYSREN